MKRSDNIEKLHELVDKLNIRDAEVFKFNEIVKAALGVTGYWDWDLVSNHTYLDSGLKDWLGYPVDVVFDDWTIIIHPEDLVKMEVELNKHFESGGDYGYRLTLRFKHFDGEYRTILATGTVVSWIDKENNIPARMVGVYIDMTHL